eukprot:1126540_1
MIAAFTVLMFQITITISECVDKSNEIINLEQQCGLQSTHTVYFGSSFDEISNTWVDLSGNCRNVEDRYISEDITTHPNTLNGETYISGGPFTQILFPDDVLPFEWTFFHVAKYNGEMKQRIFQSIHPYNVLFGFWNGMSGMALHQSWITQSTQDMHGSNWVFSTDQRNMYRSNGIDRTIASQSSKYANNQYRLCINTGNYPTQPSDFAIAAILVFDYELSLNEYECVEEYLFAKYNTSNPTTRSTSLPSTQPTQQPTNHPTTLPTHSPTTRSYSIQHIDGNVSCSNLHENVGIQYDKEKTECLDWCSDRDDCEMFNYFEDFKQINDSRCYIFDTLCDVRVDNDRKSMIGYFEIDKECVNYPLDWTDNTGDDCDYYQSYNWCQNETLLRNENDFVDLIDYKYQLTALDSCCECGGGIHVMDGVAFSTDDWIDFEHDILCTWQHSAFTPQSSLRNWNNIILYDLCDELEDVNCNMLIDTGFNEIDYDYSLYVCDMDGTLVEQTDANFSFVFDAVINDETQTHDVYINALWFNLDLDYYSSNVNIFQLNYSKCVENIMNSNAINQTTNHGIHPCYVVDSTNNPTRHPSNLPSLETFDPSHYPTYSPTLDPIIVHLITTPMSNNAPTDQVSIGNGTFARDNALAYVLIGIASLLLVVCSVGVILLFCMYKKKDEGSDETLGMDFGDDYNKNMHHRPSAPALQEAEDEEREDKNVYCILCCERKANMFNDPCGHVTYCNKCSSINEDNNCPSCRQVITEFKQLYNAGFAQ